MLTGSGSDFERRMKRGNVLDLVSHRTNWGCPCSEGIQLITVYRLSSEPVLQMNSNTLFKRL